jgi:hypothetical protein
MKLHFIRENYLTKTQRKEGWQEKETNNMGSFDGENDF